MNKIDPFRGCNSCVHPYQNMLLGLILIDWRFLLAEISMASKLVVGIDIGSSKCCAGVYKNEAVQILRNGLGSRTTSSFVAFTDTGRSIGEGAKNQATTNPNTVFGFKTTLSDYSATEGDENDSKSFRVSYKNTNHQLQPVELYAMMLKKMASVASLECQSSVEDVVLAVPAYFDESQRRAVKNAAAIAKLNVLCILNEPTAVAIAYHNNERNLVNKMILVVDAGSGGISIAAASISKTSIEVLGIGGSKIGGDYLDNQLMEYFQSKIPSKAPLDDKSARRLRFACEEVKRRLSCSEKVNIRIDNFMNGSDFENSINQTELTDLISPLKHQIEKMFSEFLLEFQLSKHDFSEVLLTGGFSRILFLKNCCSEFFKVPIITKLNAEEAVTEGLVLQAAYMMDDDDRSKVYIQDIVNMTNKAGEKVVVRLSTTRNHQDSLSTQSEKVDRRGPALLQSSKILSSELRMKVLMDRLDLFDSDDKDNDLVNDKVNVLEKLCFSTKKAIKDSEGMYRHFCQIQKNKLEAMCDEVLCWVDDSDCISLADCNEKVVQIQTATKKGLDLHVDEGQCECTDREEKSCEEESPKRESYLELELSKFEEPSEQINHHTNEEQISSLNIAKEPDSFSINTSIQEKDSDNKGSSNEQYVTPSPSFDVEKLEDVDEQVPSAVEESDNLRVTVEEELDYHDGHFTCSRLQSSSDEMCCSPGNTHQLTQEDLDEESWVIV